MQPANATREARAFWGMQRTLVQNLVTGVTEGFTKVGASFSRQNYGDGLFRAAMADKVGYSHA